MREFLKAELKTLHLKTGLQQYFKLSEMVNDKGEPDGERQIRILIDSMVLACNDFPMIPDEDKRKIIQAAIVRDQDFTGLHSRVIWRWLNGNKDRFIKPGQQAEQSSAITYEQYVKDCERCGVEPLSQDEWRSPVTTERIAAFLATLRPDPPKYDFKVIEAEKRKIEQEDHERQEGRRASGYVMPTPEELLQQQAERELRLRWRRENFFEDGITKRPCYCSFEDWAAVLEALNPRKALNDP